MNSNLSASVFIVVVTMLLICTSYVRSDEIDDNETIKFGEIKIYDIERRCAMFGGICVEKNDCTYLASGSGLCPKNQHLGVECCYEIAERRLPCNQHSGMCMPRCNTKLQRPASDCNNDDVCCVLV